MGLITRFWKKVLYFLITGSTSVFIAACYGMPAGYGLLGVWTVKTKDNKNQPIEGLEVTVVQFEQGSDYPDTLGTWSTDSTGTAECSLTTYNVEAAHKHKAIIRDIDGDENGGAFKDTVIVKSMDDEVTVQLELK